MTISIPELRQNFDGGVIAPGDESYERVRC